MNRTEFNQWWKDYAGRFPSVNAWLNKLDDDVATRQLSTWLETFADGRTNLADALEVSRLMSIGRLEPVGSYDSEREKTAVYVRRAADKLRHRREKKPDPAGPLQRYEPRRRAKRDAVQVKSVLGSLIRLLDSGRTREEAAREVFGEIVDSEDRRDRVSCPICKDYGTLTVWSWRSVAAYREDPELIDYRTNRSTMSVPCTCDASTKFVGHGRAWEDNGVRYDASRYCIADYGETETETAIAEFRLWCAAYFDRIDHERTSRLGDATADNPF